MPEWMERIYELMDAVDNYKTIMERAVDAVVEQQFAQHISEAQFSIFFCKLSFYMQNFMIQLFISLGRLMDKMSTVLPLLKSMTENNFAETSRLFFQANSSPQKQPSIPCRVEKQEEFLQCLYNLSGLIKKMNTFLGDESIQIDPNERIEQFVSKK